MRKSAVNRMIRLRTSRKFIPDAGKIVGAGSSKPNAPLTFIFIIMMAMMTTIIVIKKKGRRAGSFGRHSRT
jgi:hypothetical protein